MAAWGAVGTRTDGGSACVCVWGGGGGGGGESVQVQAQAAGVCQFSWLVTHVSVPGEWATDEHTCDVVRREGRREPDPNSWGGSRGFQGSLLSCPQCPEPMLVPPGAGCTPSWGPSSKRSSRGDGALLVLLLEGPPAAESSPSPPWRDDPCCPGCCGGTAGRLKTWRVDHDGLLGAGLLPPGVMKEVDGSGSSSWDPIGGREPQAETASSGPTQASLHHQ